MFDAPALHIEAAAQPQPTHTDWQSLHDHATGQPYYHNSATQQTLWELPHGQTATPATPESQGPPLSNSAAAKSAAFTVPSSSAYTAPGDELQRVWYSAMGSVPPPYSAMSSAPPSIASTSALPRNYPTSVPSMVGAAPPNYPAAANHNFALAHYPNASLGSYPTSVASLPPARRASTHRAMGRRCRVMRRASTRPVLVRPARGLRTAQASVVRWQQRNRRCRKANSQ